MTRADGNLPGGTTDIRDGLRARTALAEKINPDMYISIHISHSGEQTATAETGFEIFVPNQETQRVNQSKQLGSAIAGELSTLYATNQNLKQSTDKNIWVLQRTPCPALLIECGFINNEKDLAYISNSSNQEAIAKRILEGIVRYASKPVSMAVPAAITPTNHNFQDTILYKIKKYFNRNFRYPKQALANNVEGVVYFSLAVDEKGKLTNFKCYDEAPPEANSINNLIIISYAANTPPPAVTPSLTKEETQKLFRDVVKGVYDNKPKFTDEDQLPPVQYYFKATFRLEKKQTPTT
jgi:hypothetical protein